jgi:hypothetical protein
VSPSARSIVGRLREIGPGGVARRVQLRIGRAERERKREAWLQRFGPGAAPPARAEAAALRARLRAAPFFLDAGDLELADAFAARHPSARDTILRHAENALRGDLAFVGPHAAPDWHAAAPRGGRWPLVPPGEAGIGDAVPRGDVRLAWETGRCTHLLRAAQAAWLTRERRFAAYAIAGLRDFAAANPPGLGIAWAHAQEVGLRAVAWLWVLRLLDARDAVDDETLALLAVQLDAHAGYVAAFLGDGPVTHNHLVSEAAALAVLGTALPFLTDAADLARLGFATLWREVAKQIDADGASGEHSLHYLGFVLDSFVAAAALAERAGAPAPPRARARIAKVAEALARFVRADGTLPAIGDSDAGRACRLGTDPLDRRDTLAAAAVLFARADLGAVAGDAAGAFWLTGGAEVPGAGVPAHGGAWRLADAGLAVARTGYGGDEEIAVFRAGPTRFRPDVLLSHAHADALSVLLRVAGEDVLADPGTYLYSESEGWRALFRGTRAHGTVTVDGADQADVSSQRFGIAGLRPARWLGFAGDDSHLVAEAEHPDEGTVRVRRRVVWLRGGTLALCDDVAGAARGIEVRFQLPETTGEAAGAAAELRLASGRRVRVEALSGAQAVQVLRPAGDGPGPGWLAPRFGELRRGTSVAVHARPEGAATRIVTLVQTPAPGKDPEPARLEAAAGGLVLELGARRIELPDRGLARLIPG